MDINFLHIIPDPLKEILSASEIWNSALTIHSGEKVLVTAPSGKGKSTFLNIIYGIRKDFSGQLDFNNSKDSSASSEINWDSLRRTELSMVHQGLELFDHLTALENVQLKNDILNHKGLDEIEHMFDLLGIGRLKNQSSKTLSFGQRQRVAIIRALCQPFSWLLLDEPFSHLDEENSVQALQLIQSEVEKNNAGIILTSLGSMPADGFTKSLQL